MLRAGLVKAHEGGVSFTRGAVRPFVTLSVAKGLSQR